MRKLLYISLCVFSVAGCSDDPRPVLPAVMPLVVEGWIEEGERPVVIVTRAIDLTKPMDSIENYVEKWCRVSIDDGDSKYYLTARVNHDYIPSFVYTSSKIRGRRGVDYTLTIETDDDTLRAVTSILPSVKIDSVRVSKTANSDTLYQINVFPRISPDTDEGYYKFFSRVVNKESRYYSSFLGIFEGRVYDPVTGFSVSKGIHNTFEGEHSFSPYYVAGDTVDIKLCTLLREQFDFWTAYENSVSLSGNVFFNLVHDCPSNIPGALGYWFGYGAFQRRVIVRAPQAGPNSL